DLQPRRLRRELRRQVRLQDGREARDPGGGHPRQLTRAPQRGPSGARGPAVRVVEIAVPHLNRSTTSSAIASEAVSPGDSIPKRLMSPGTPGVRPSPIRKSPTGWPGPEIPARTPA